jgi:hypothetical protein
LGKIAYLGGKYREKRSKTQHLGQIPNGFLGIQPREIEISIADFFANFPYCF